VIRPTELISSRLSRWMSHTNLIQILAKSKLKVISMRDIN